MARGCFCLVLCIVVMLYLAEGSISYEQAVKLLKKLCSKCKEPKDCKECKTVLKVCDPMNGTAPYLGDVPNIKVAFNNTAAYITWDPINVTGKVGAANWTGYYVMWYKPHAQTQSYEEFSFDGNCEKLDKTATRIAVVPKTGDWTSLIVHVTTAPMPNNSDYSMAEFYPVAKEVSVPPIPPQMSGTTASQMSGTNILAIVGGSIGGLVMVLILAIVLWYRNGLCSSPDPHMENDYDFHVFISYSREDDVFLSKTILPLLDKHEIRYCIDFKDWLAGIPWLENLINSLTRSSKVLFIASVSFLQKKNCLKEIDQALYWRGDRSNIIVLRIDSFDIKLLPRALRGRTFIDYNSKLERLAWQGRLIKALKDTPVLSQSQPITTA